MTAPLALFVLLSGCNQLGGGSKAYYDRSVDCAAALIVGSVLAEKMNFDRQEMVTNLGGEYLRRAQYEGSKIGIGEADAEKAVSSLSEKYRKNIVDGSPDKLAEKLSSCASNISQSDWSKK